MKPVVQVQNVSKQFGSAQESLAVLDAVSVALRPSEVVGIVGKSGCGKTTLLNIVAGLEKPSTGSVVVNGLVGYVPQKEFFLPWRTVLENVLLPLEIANRLDGQKKQAIQLLRQRGLGDFVHAYPAELSGGMRQKCALVRAILQDANVLLFDESFSAIDFDERLVLAQQTRAYLHWQHKSAFFVTHNIEEAIAVSDRILVFSNRPAKIARQIMVLFSEKERAPVALRKNPRFAELFSQIWNELRESK